MTPDEDILRAIQKLPEHRRSELQPLIDEYSSACGKAQGSRLDQLAYWNKRALGLEDDLRKQIKVG